MRSGNTHRHNSKVAYKDLDMYSVLYHPKYFELVDTARNQAFEDFGYPVEEQLKDKVGFTVASIDGVRFKKPIFMGQKISVYTKVTSVQSKSCIVLHWITNEEHESLEDDLESAIFIATYTLVFVDISLIPDFPLNAQNIKGMRAITFNEKVKSKLNF